MLASKTTSSLNSNVSILILNFTLIMKISVKAHVFNKKATVCYTKIENIIEVVELLFLGKNLFSTQNRTSFDCMLLSFHVRVSERIHML